MQLPRGWRSRTVGEFAKVVSGYAFSSSVFRSSGIPVVKIKNIRDGFADLDEADCVDEEYSSLDPKYHIKGGDLLISLTGSHLTQPGSVVGRVASYSRHSPHSLLNQRAGKIIVRQPEECDSRFLYYVLRNPGYARAVALMAHGAASQANISPAQVESLQFACPPVSAQRKIAAILSAYDDLIENNTRRIKILEEMAQAIYREWFVNFRFPGHENVKMVESEIGLIPEGWEVSVLGKHLAVDKGISYKGEGLTPDGNPMVNLKCIAAGGGFCRQGTKPYSGDFKERHTVRPGDLLVANTDLTQAGNVIGSPAIVPGLLRSSVVLFSHHLYAVRMLEGCGLTKYYLYNLLLTPDFKSFAKGMANGTTVLGLPREGVLDFRLVEPPKPVLRAYEGFATPLYGLAELLEDKNDALHRTRDLLLPKLISGEVDVSELDIRLPGGES